MKKKLRADLLENANRLMAAHGKGEIFATQDGNFFLKNADAAFHNNSIKATNPEWDGEIISFSSSVGTENKQTVTDEDIANNPVLIEMGIKVGDVVTLPTDDAIKAFKLKAAKATVKVTEKAVSKAAELLGKAEKASAKKPEDEALKKAAVAASNELQTAQSAFESAKKELADLEAE